MDETQNDAPFVAFYDMHAVTCVSPDEMVIMLIICTIKNYFQVIYINEYHEVMRIVSMLIIKEKLHKSEQFTT